MESTLQEDLIGKYLSGELTPAEQGDLMSWVDSSPENQAVFEEMIQLWSLTDEQAEYDFPVKLSNAWAVLDQRIDNSTTVGTQPSTAKPSLQVVHNQPTIRNLNWVGSAAAAIAVLVFAAWWIFGREITPQSMAVSTTLNESRSITLPDSSKVVLNENSNLSYSYAGKNREVQLVGEAFFEVSKNPQHPFIIHTGEVQTKVLGTSFNVRAYPDEEKIKVSVKTGTVEVSTTSTNPNKAKPLILLPGKTGIYNNQDATLEKALDVATEDVDTWKQGILVFESGIRLSEVIPTIEKFYDITISTDLKILNCTITRVRFTHEMPKDTALSLITLPISAKFNKDKDGTYQISGKGCN
ncbi:FecR domain-containing protein [Haliscomenobacter sp.]|uniref:FecR domain-containing protein n=1 Tax=Haliscomenobacter sp. TaxID=2717303 RepID=UPI003364EB02